PCRWTRTPANPVRERMPEPGARPGRPHHFPQRRPVRAFFVVACDVRRVDFVADLRGAFPAGRLAEDLPVAALPAFVAFVAFLALAPCVVLVALRAGFFDAVLRTDLFAALRAPFGASSCEGGRRVFVRGLRSTRRFSPIASSLPVTRALTKPTSLPTKVPGPSQYSTVRTSTSSSARLGSSLPSGKNA